MIPELRKAFCTGDGLRVIVYSSVPEGLEVADQSVLVAGPPMSGKSDLLDALLRSAADRHVLVSTADPVGVVRDRLADSDELGVVDCVTRTQRVDATDTELTKYASATSNLTEIGMKFTGLVESLDGEAVAVGVDSISEPLVYRETTAVYQFVRTLVGQATGAGWPTVATVSTEGHDARAVEVVLEAFDVVVDTRVEDGDRQCRLRSGDETREWQGF